VNDLLAKLTSYNIFNNLLPGALFCAAASYLGLFHISDTNVVVLIVAYYLVGLIIGRIGSVIIEPLLLRLGWIGYSPYDAFVKASKMDTKLDVLVETNNTYRALLSTAVCLLASLLLAYARKFLPENSILDQATTITAIAFLFFFAYRKQSMYIRKRVEANTPQVSQNTELEGLP